MLIFFTAILFTLFSSMNPVEVRAQTANLCDEIGFRQIILDRMNETIRQNNITDYHVIDVYEGETVEKSFEPLNIVCVYTIEFSDADVLRMRTTFRKSSLGQEVFSYEPIEQKSQEQQDLEEVLEWLQKVQ